MLCAALLRLDTALGVCCNTTGLLIGKQAYLYHADRMAEMAWTDPDYFPVPLWVLILLQQQDGLKQVIETRGLNEFGLPELGFYAPKLPVPGVLNRLYTTSSWEITGRQRYRNMALIPLTEEIEVVCEQSGPNKLYFFGA